MGFGLVAVQISGQNDLQLGRNSIATGGTEFTTVTLASTFASSTVLIPWSTLVQRWLYGIKGRAGGIETTVVLHAANNALGVIGYRPRRTGPALTPGDVDTEKALTPSKPDGQTNASTPRRDRTHRTAPGGPQR